MDEVENPDLPAAGEASPTLRPIEEDEDSTGNKPPLDTVEADGILEQPSQPTPQQQAQPTRPGLKRESSAPAPQQPPPAPPPSNNDDFPTDSPDSLTLADLRRIRSTFPTVQTPQKQQLEDYGQVYDFEYADAQSLPVEVEEWFGYGEVEAGRLGACRESYQKAWEADDGWTDAEADGRRGFVRKGVRALAHDGVDAGEALMCLTYIGLGVWEETAGRRDGGALGELFPDYDKAGSRLDEYGTSNWQLHLIVGNIETLHACGALQTIYTTLQNIAARDANNASDAPSRNEPQATKRPEESTEMWCCLTLLYLFLEVARSTNNQKLRKDIASLQPNLLTYLTQTVAKLRWEENLPIPLTKILLLCWKTILVTLGGIQDVEDVKASLRDSYEEKGKEGEPLITASPLDYHLFRQEISSKYPAYAPPLPLFPLEPENNTILPPLPHRHAPITTPSEPTTSGSILHQPIHIATPAPSPPPSPAGPGKAGKKQNYQTNQMFPFLYPPLDGTSNALGGKGSTEMQDLWVGRRWEGSDVPASILEGAELFARRMRATRGMRQLWDVRIDYMKSERGWDGREKERGGAEEVGEKVVMDEGLKKSLEVLKELRELGIDGMQGLEDLDLDRDAGSVEDFDMLDKPPPEETAPQGEPLPQTEEQRRLDAVKAFYEESLQHLQSLVIVLLKAVLQNVTDLVTKSSNGQTNGLQAGIQFTDPANPSSNTNGTIESTGDSTAEELDRLRSQEIAAKAISGVLLLLLKWFKVVHVLMFEYLTQLLVDSNYVPLVLKLWQTMEVGRACHYRLERKDKDFFAWCLKEKSRRSRKGSGEEETEDDDEACPPPIKLKRDSAAEDEHPLSPLQPANAADYTTHPPELDELGYPLTPLPLDPLKTYSYRNIFSSINYLRILQKITRRKTHRALLLINYKSSNHLKKTLKVPVKMLRYYTLKLFKSQVPFCGRKWRQGNMKIITAVWLSVPAELRDDWLSGGGGGMGGACVGDVDGTVEDALPLEQSLRSLTYWWNLRNFGRAMGVDRGMKEEERSFFERELERMEGLRGEGEVGVDGHGEVGEEPGSGGGMQWQGQGPVEGY
ncbi:Factor arrest protein 11 [Vermiconidia calcicola]|uniref:Factor arrest protein 11 n=1 Tax=Vermiconidia calcicola TaxID=1690605 RepID=A0ACC3N5J2_9PEZI|nr:Factor arrest protein 11 [Vermiconidia calcicola]